MEFLSTIAEFLKTTTGVITTAITLIAAIWKGITAINKKVVIPIKEHFDDIKIIKKQIFPNGGSSLADQIMSLRREVIVALAMTRATLRMTGKAYWVSDKDGECVEASPELCHLLGLTPQQILGYGWVNALDPKEKLSVKTEWESSVKEDREFAMSYKVGPKDKLVYVFAQAVPIRDEFNKLAGFVGWMVPIEEN